MKRCFLLSGTISALLLINNGANGISDPEFISQVIAEKNKQTNKIPKRGFVASLGKKSLSCPPEKMKTSLFKKTMKFLRNVSEASVCFDCEENVIAGCKCHSSCSKCSWDEVFECELDHDEPSEPINCEACADGSALIQAHDLNSGYYMSHGLCGDESYCYDECGDLSHDYTCELGCAICHTAYFNDDDNDDDVPFCVVCKDGSYRWSEEDWNFERMSCFI